MRELSDEECDRLATDCGLPYATESERAMIRAGYAAGYAAAQAAMPPREPTQAMVNAGEKRRREIAGRGLCIGTIWCAMYDAWAQEQTSGAASAVTDGPAADPIADLCAELRATHCSNENLHDNAAYELERLARTERLLQACVRHETARAERAEAERDALREVVRAADYMRTREEHSGSSPGCVSCAAIAAYDAARAKVDNV